MLKIQQHSKVYLFIILVFAFLLRIIYLNDIPNGFFTDEASNAYDAYSILHTLRDQYGELLPWYFKSANDYREGLYMYIMFPFIKFFGLNPLGARIISSVIGTLTVLITYYLSKEIFNQKIGLFSSFLLAISPWHIHFSRVTFRAILVPCIFCLGLLFFIKSFKYPKYLIISSFVFAISIYTYNSARLFIPLFLIGVVAIYWKHLWINKDFTIISLIIFLIIFSPQFIYQLSPEGMARANTVGIKTNLSIVFHNYLSYFSPDFLFFEGDPSPRHTINKMAGLFTFQLPLLIIGILSLVRETNIYKSLIFLWLLLYPIPAAFISADSAVRTLVVTPLFSIISSYTVFKAINLFNKKYRYIVTCLIISIIVSNVTIFCKRYFIEYPNWHTDVWLSTLGETISYADQTSYECIIYSNNAYGNYAYILIPFFTKMFPEEYHKFNVDVSTNQLDMGRWNIQKLEASKDLNTSCLYLLSGDPNANNPKGQDGQILKAKGYEEKFIYSIKDIKNREFFRLVEIKKS